MDHCNSECNEPCVCCELEYEEFNFFDSTKPHKGVDMIKSEPEYKSNFIAIGDKKQLYFYNNTLTMFHVVLVRSMTDYLDPDYSPAIRLQVSTVQKPIPILIFGTGEYMCIQTCNNDESFFLMDIAKKVTEKEFEERKADKDPDESFQNIHTNKF
ncbi:Hypothetical predicted protein [Paramuricea clavata]|uniref:Uncharacterized protein n=1 Tax=Paramuricea clavata TaxID=317549 RepID=A0A7D9D630_PARCT|nr:Hypothetical predicted protein [Paramuricea clavata]